MGGNKITRWNRAWEKHLTKMFYTYIIHWLSLIYRFLLVIEPSAGHTPLNLCLKILQSAEIEKLIWKGVWDYRLKKTRAGFPFWETLKEIFGKKFSKKVNRSPASRATNCWKRLHTNLSGKRQKPSENGWNRGFRQDKKVIYTK